MQRPKNRRNLQGKYVNAPQAEEESILGHLLLGGRDLEDRTRSALFSSFNLFLRATTNKRKRLSTFIEEKSALAENIVATPMYWSVGNKPFFLTIM